MPNWGCRVGEVVLEQREHGKMLESLPGPSHSCPLSQQDGKSLEAARDCLFLCPYLICLKDYGHEAPKPYVTRGVAWPSCLLPTHHLPSPAVSAQPLALFGSFRRCSELSSESTEAHQLLLSGCEATEREALSLPATPPHSPLHPGRAAPVFSTGRPG